MGVLRVNCAQSHKISHIMPVKDPRKMTVLSLQRLAYSLLLPVALLPIAVLLHRMGQVQGLDIPLLAKIAQGIFWHMPLFFALAIAYGLNRHELLCQPLAGAINFFLLKTAFHSLAPTLQADMLCGLLAGLTTAIIYPWLHSTWGTNTRWHNELVALVGSALGCLFMALPLPTLWPIMEHGLTLLTNDMLTTPLGAFCYGVLNRLLVPLALHPLLGSVIGLSQENLQALAHAKPLHEGYVAGLYPIIMFGLPGACLAIWLRRHSLPIFAQGKWLLSLALISAFIGITEPIEFLFAFTAPLLFLAHLLLTGLSMAICCALGIKVGSYFSAGLVDFVLSYQSGVQSFWLIPVGILFFTIYSLLFYQLVQSSRLDLLAQYQPKRHSAVNQLVSATPQMLAINYLKLLGGMDNLVALSVYLTRLSIRVHDMSLVDQDKLLSLGCLSWIVLSEQQIILVIGSQAEVIEKQIRMLAERQSVPLGAKPADIPISHHLG